MPNLKSIKERINSINNTQKITKAMKMVAAAKVKKSENAAKQGRPFTKELAYAFARLMKSLGTSKDLETGLKFERAIDNYPKLLEKREVKTEGLLVITSNKGLAGGYNANLIRYTLKKIAELNAEGKKVKLFVVGQKGLVSLKHKKANYNFEIIKSYTKVAAEPNSTIASLIAEDMAKAYVEKEIDSIDIITTTFKNMMSYKVTNWQILPLNFNPDEHLKEEKENKISSDMIFEPSKEAILQKIVPMFLTNTIFHALLEANASELASRMAAMSAACRNAEEMIRTLTIDYNKARQAAITQELTEI